jgi:hypothetical protein
MIRADLKAWLREFGALLDIATFEDLFLKRLDAPRDFRFPLAVDRFFLQRQDDAELGLRGAIDAYRARRISEWEQDIFKQRKRYADAQRDLKTKPTKKAEADIGIASRKIEQGLARRDQDAGKQARRCRGACHELRPNHHGYR